MAPYYYKSVLEYIDLIHALETGVNVKILTSKNRDIQCYSTFKNRILFDSLINKGAKVHEYTSNFLHGKAFLFDNKTLSMGSFNLDGWSFKNNTGKISNS